MAWARGGWQGIGLRRPLLPHRFAPPPLLDPPACRPQQTHAPGSWGAAPRAGRQRQGLGGRETMRRHASTGSAWERRVGVGRRWGKSSWVGDGSMGSGVEEGWEKEAGRRASPTSASKPPAARTPLGPPPPLASGIASPAAPSPFHVASRSRLWDSTSAYLSSLFSDGQVALRHMPALPVCK